MIRSYKEFFFLYIRSDFLNEKIKIYCFFNIRIISNKYCILSFDGMLNDLKKVYILVKIIWFDTLVKYLIFKNIFIVSLSLYVLLSSYHFIKFLYTLMSSKSFFASSSAYFPLFGTRTAVGKVFDSKATYLSVVFVESNIGCDFENFSYLKIFLQKWKEKNLF